MIILIFLNVNLPCQGLLFTDRGSPEWIKDCPGRTFSCRQSVWSVCCHPRRKWKRWWPSVHGTVDVVSLSIGEVVLFAVALLHVVVVHVGPVVEVVVVKTKTSFDLASAPDDLVIVHRGVGHRLLRLNPANPVSVQYFGTLPRGAATTPARVRREALAGLVEVVVDHVDVVRSMDKVLSVVKVGGGGSRFGGDPRCRKRRVKVVTWGWTSSRWGLSRASFKTDINFRYINWLGILDYYFNRKYF